jgi:hypothetical protein
MSNCLNFIDVFGEKVKIYINNRETVTSSLGGALTIIMLGLITTATWLIGKDIIYKQSPFSYQESLVMPNFPELNLSHSNFPIAFAVYDFDDNVVENNTIFKIEVVMNEVVHINGASFTNSTVLDLIPCENRHFPYLTEEEFTQSTINQCKCLKDDNVSLVGYWSEVLFRFIHVTLSKCVNEPNCASNEEIKSYIKNTGINLNIIYFSPFLENTNYIEPIKQSLTIKYLFALLSQSKLVGYGLEKDYLITDTGFIVEDKNATEFYSLNEIQTLDTLDIDEETGALVTFEIYSSNKYTNYYRKYIKIPEILASVGGLINVSIIVFGFINLPFSRFNKNIYAINNLVDVENLNSENKPNSQIKPVVKDTLKQFIDTKIINIQPSNKNVLQLNSGEVTNVPNNVSFIKTTEKIKKLFRNRKKLSFNYLEKLKMFICRKCYKSFPQEFIEKSNKYDVGVHFINSYFDLVRIIKKLIEFDLLKKVLFSKEQSVLFEILSKVKSNDSIEKEHLVNMESYVKGLYEKEQKTIVDSNLIKLLK